MFGHLHDLKNHSTSFKIEAKPCSLGESALTRMIHQHQNKKTPKQRGDNKKFVQAGILQAQKCCFLIIGFWLKVARLEDLYCRRKRSKE